MAYVDMYIKYSVWTYSVVDVVHSASCSHQYEAACVLCKVDCRCMDLLSDRA